MQLLAAMDPIAVTNAIIKVVWQVKKALSDLTCIGEDSKLLSQLVEGVGKVLEDSKKYLDGNQPSMPSAISALKVGHRGIFLTTEIVFELLPSPDASQELKAAMDRCADIVERLAKERTITKFFFSGAPDISSCTHQ